MTYVIGISGPPRSGKDTLANVLTTGFSLAAQRMSLSTPMRHAIYAMLGKDYTETDYETRKDMVQEQLGGQTIRQAMIALSEEHVKPRYGEDFWARSTISAVMQLHDRPQLLVIPDMGFDEEVEALEDAFGADNCMWPHLSRPNHSFRGDSRGYVGRPERVVPLHNPGVDGAAFFHAAAMKVMTIADVWGWKFS